MAEGTGEFFDLSVKPIYRDTFLLGTAEQKEQRATAWKFVPSALWREDRGGRKMRRTTRRTVIMLFSFFCPR